MEYYENPIEEITINILSKNCYYTNDTGIRFYIRTLSKKYVTTNLSPYAKGLLVKVFNKINFSMDIGWDMSYFELNFNKQKLKTLTKDEQFIFTCFREFIDETFPSFPQELLDFFK